MKIKMLFTAMLLFPLFLKADVIRIKDGRIFLGKIVSTDSSGITIESFGEKKQFRHNEILETSNNMNSLKDSTVEVNLLDGSVMKGKIQDYDDEVGILIDGGFGRITLPVKNVKAINDYDQKKRHLGRDILAGFSGGYYLPIGTAGDNFGSSFIINLFVEINPGFSRNIFVGGDLDYLNMNCTSASNVKFFQSGFHPYLSYRFFSFQDSKSFLKKVTPFVSAGIGASYIIRNDDRANASSSQKSEIDLSFLFKAGADYSITERVFVRLSMFGYYVTQKNDAFTVAGLSAGAVFTF